MADDVMEPDEPDEGEQGQMFEMGSLEGEGRTLKTLIKAG
jgi:hypothetical protein